MALQGHPRCKEPGQVAVTEALEAEGVTASAHGGDSVETRLCSPLGAKHAGAAHPACAGCGEDAKHVIEEEVDDRHLGCSDDCGRRRGRDAASTCGVRWSSEQCCHRCCPAADASEPRQTAQVRRSTREQCPEGSDARRARLGRGRSERRDEARGDRDDLAHPPRLARLCGSFEH